MAFFFVFGRVPVVLADSGRPVVSKGVGVGGAVRTPSTLPVDASLHAYFNSTLIIYTTR